MHKLHIEGKREWLLAMRVFGSSRPVLKINFGPPTTECGSDRSRKKNAFQYFRPITKVHILRFAQQFHS